MLPSGLEGCSQADWEDAVIRATKFAHRLSAKLPRHLTVSDVVHTAVHQVLASTRKFDLKEHSLAAVLCGTVRSILSPKGLAEFKNRMPLASERQLASAIVQSADDEALFTAAERDQIMERVCQLAPGDHLFRDYVDGFRSNFSQEEIAELLGVPIENCYELKRRLKTLTIRAVEELKPADLQHVSR
jgi:hypothetical protein